MKTLYVYYRVLPVHLAQAQTRIGSLFSAMAPHCGTPPRQQVRCDDPTTWMEIYDAIADEAAFIGTLAATSEALGYTALIDGARHIECFSSPQALSEKPG